jgi:hypothetical protein
VNEWRCGIIITKSTYQKIGDFTGLLVVVMAILNGVTMARLGNGKKKGKGEDLKYTP